MGEYNKIEYMNGYLVLYTNTNDIEVRDIKGNLKSIYDNAKMIWILDSDMTYVVSQGKLYKQMIGQNLDDNEAIFLNSIDYQIGDFNKEQNELYLCTTQGIIDKYNKDGEFQERVLDMSKGFIEENKFISNNESILVCDNEIYLLCNSMDRLVTCIKKIKIEDNKISDRKGISILTMDNNPMLNEVIRLYKSENQGEILKSDKVNIYGADDGERQRLIQRTNTEIITGKSSDILSLASLPYDQYIKKEVLLVIGSTNELSKRYHEGIIKAYDRDGDIYHIPLGIQLPVMLVNEKALQKMGINKEWDNYNFEEIIDTRSNIEESDIYLLPKGSTNYLAHYMTTVYYDNYIHKNLDGNWEEGLKNLLEELKFILELEHPVYTEEDMILNTRGEMNQVILIPTIIMEYKSLEEGYSYKSMPILGSKYYPSISMDVIGISANTDNNYNAIEFVNYALSEKIQMKIGKEGFPINEKARKKLKEESNSKNKAEVDKLIDNINGIFHNDGYIKSIRLESAKFLKGECNIDEALHNIKQQISIMKEE